MIDVPTVTVSVVSSVVVTILVLRIPIVRYRKAFENNTKAMNRLIKDLAEGRKPTKIHRPTSSRTRDIED